MNAAFGEELAQLVKARAVRLCAADSWMPSNAAVSAPLLFSKKRSASNARSLFAQPLHPFLQERTHLPPDVVGI